MYKKSIVASLFLMSSIPVFSNAEFVTDPELLNLVKIEGVKAGGTGCHVNDKGEPADFSVIQDSQGQSFIISFDKFEISGEDAIQTKDCTLSIIASYPQGTSLYVYESRSSGQSELEDDDTATLETYLKLPNYTYPKSLITKIKPENSRWETVNGEYTGNQNAPCGGDFYKIQFSMNLILKGTEYSYVRIGSSKGVIDPTKIKFKLKKCK